MHLSNVSKVLCVLFLIARAWKKGLVSRRALKLHKHHLLSNRGAVGIGSDLLLLEVDGVEPGNVALFCEDEDLFLSICAVHGVVEVGDGRDLLVVDG